MKKIMSKANWKKKLSLFLVIILLQSSLARMGALSVFAEMSTENAEAVIEDVLDVKDVPSFVTEEAIEEYGHVKRLYEYETDLNTVVFQNRNGTQTIYYMGYPLRFVGEDGVLQEIDLTLKEVGTEFQVSSNDIQVSIAERYDDGIRLEYEDISVNLVAMPHESLGLFDNISTTTMVTTEKIDDSVVYKNVFGEGTTIKYTPIFDGVKEDIILAKYTGDNQFYFLLYTNGLGVYESQEGDYYLAEAQDSPKRVEFGEVVAYDAKNDMHLGNILITPIKDGYIYQIVVSVDTGFLTDVETVYPVTIDPTLTISDETHGAGAIQDVPVYSNLETRNFGSNKYNFVGYSDSTYGTGRTVVRLQGLLDSPIYATLSAANVTSAKFYVKDSSGQSNRIVNIYALTSNSTWTESNLTWATTGAMSTALLSSASLGKAKWSSFDITDLVRHWLNNIYNEECGFIMKGVDETLKANFHSSECSTVANRPYFTITYEYGETSGIESGQTYFIKNVYSGHYLQADTSMNNEVIQNVFHGDSYQQWKVVYQGNGLYKLYNQYAGYVYSPFHENRCCLDLVDPETGEIDLYIDTTYDYVYFYIIPNGDGSYRILNYWPRWDEVLTVPDGYALSNVYNGSWEKDSKQKWRFELATTKLNDRKTFSIFDVGDSAEDEAALVKRYLEYDGYTSVGIYDNKNYYVPAQAIKDVGRYSDVVYLNGHGGFYANLFIRDIDKVTREYLCAEESVDMKNSIPKVGIGAQWKDGSTTKTTSYWNKKTKWVIMAQCDQMNYFNRIDIDQTVEYEDGMQPAELWARTLLGDGHRMHGYLGYYNGAPKGAAHYNRLENFLIHSSKDNNISLINAWILANDSSLVDVNWAALYHSANVNDTFTSFTPGTSSGAQHTIYLLRNEVPDVELELPSQTGGTGEIIIQNCETMRPILYDAFTEDENKNICDRLRLKLGVNETASLQLEENGMISYYNQNVNRGDADMAYNLSDEQAIILAKSMLSDLALLPNNNYRTCVSRVERLKFDATNNSFEKPEIIEYAVYFYQTYNGIDVVSDQQDGITIRFNKDGIISLNYLWRDIKITSADVEVRDVKLTRERAEEIFQEKVNERELETSKIVTQAYLQLGGQTRFVWVVADDDNYRNATFIDAYTGEVLVLE